MADPADINEGREEVLSANSLVVQKNGCIKCCHRPSKVYKIFSPLINHPDCDLNEFQRTWMRQAYLRYVQKIDRISLDARARFANIRRSLIVLGVVISGCILVGETTHVKDNAAASLALFWITVVISLANNFVTAFLTDLKLAERAILFYRGSSYLQAMGQTFLTCTQRYAMFPSCNEAFRTFVRDVEMAKLLVTSEDISLMSSAREQKPKHAISQTRQAWPTLMHPLDPDEAKAMKETYGGVSQDDVSIQVDSFQNLPKTAKDEANKKEEPPLEE
jgi:hypothetical protein